MHIQKRVPYREEMPFMQTRFGTDPWAGDPLHALRAHGSTVRPTEGTKTETSRHQCGRKDRAMSTPFKEALQPKGGFNEEE
jgi:hypothetical protein